MSCSKTDHHLPKDVDKAVELVQRDEDDEDEVSFENEEELALVAVLATHAGMEGLQNALEEPSQAEDERGAVLFVDMEWNKQCGNEAFQKGQWMSALKYYATVLKQAGYIDRDRNSRPPTLESFDELMATVHANTAQALLNLARNDEAMKQCQQALQMPILFSKPSLHKKVLHRLKLSQELPPMEAQLAAEEARKVRLSLPLIPVTEDTQLSLCTFPESEREARKYAFQHLARGDLLLTGTLVSICSHGSDVKYALSAARQFTLESGAAHRIEQQDILHMMELCGHGPAMAQQKAIRAQAKEKLQVKLLHLKRECQETVWDACHVQDPTQTRRRLTQPREWLNTHDLLGAIPYFLVAADRIAAVPTSEYNVCKNSKDCQAGKPGAVSDLRAIVEVAWFHYIIALRTFDLAEHGKSEHSSDDYRPRWKDVAFERKRHMMRLARGMDEPDLTSPYERMVGRGHSDEPDEKGDAKKHAASAKQPDVQKQEDYMPSLQDVSGYKLKREAHIRAVKRGLKRLMEENQNHGYLDDERFAVRQTLKRKVVALKKELADAQGNFSVVDPLWYLCLQEGEGTSLHMMELMDQEDVEKFRPPSLFVTNKHVSCPPPPPGGDPIAMRFLSRQQQAQHKLPKSTLAVQFVPGDGHFDSYYCLDIQRVLLKAIQARKGIPKKIALGPMGCMKMSYEYLHRGGGGRPIDTNAYCHEEDYGERSEIEAFLQDSLGIQEQWLEGIFGELPSFRAHEERAQQRTPEESRLKTFHRMREIAKNREQYEDEGDN